VEYNDPICPLDFLGAEGNERNRDIERTF